MDIVNQKLKEIENHVVSIVKLSRIYNITEDEVINLIKIMFKEDF